MVDYVSLESMDLGSLISDYLKKEKNRHEFLDKIYTGQEVVDGLQAYIQISNFRQQEETKRKLSSDETIKLVRKGLKIYEETLRVEDYENNLIDGETLIGALDYFYKEYLQKDSGYKKKFIEMTQESEYLIKGLESLIHNMQGSFVDGIRNTIAKHKSSIEEIKSSSETQ